MPTPTAAEIIARVKARYAGCRSYEDEGHISVRVQASTFEAPFRSSFQRDLGFTFELSSPTPGPSVEQVRGMAWIHAGGGSWWELPSRTPLGTRSDLCGALAEIALGDFLTPKVPPIAALPISLASSESGPQSEALSGLVRVREVVRYGTKCFMLRRLQGTTEARLCVDTASWLMREHCGPVDVCGMRGVATIVWTPRMDHAIHPRVFEFAPPG